MSAEKGNEPLYQDKEGNIKVQLFKNVNKKGVKYVMYKIWAYKFPFKFNRNITLTRHEIEKLRTVIDRLPVLEIEQDKKE